MMRRAGLALGIAIFLAGLATIGGPYSWLSIIALATGAIVVKVTEI